MARDVGVLDYGIGNIRSITNALRFVGATPQLIREPEKVLDYDRLIVPGVGAFAQVFATLASAGLVEPLLEASRRGRPTYGICVGMQILFERGLEFEGSPGLALLGGTVRHLSETHRNSHVRLPVIGWRDTYANGRVTGSYYFLHSYAAAPTDPAVVYETYKLEDAPVTASVCHEHLSGTQYHPERSGAQGLALLERFVETGSIRR